MLDSWNSPEMFPSPKRRWYHKIPWDYIWYCCFNTTICLVIAMPLIVTFLKGCFSEPKEYDPNRQNPKLKIVAFANNTGTGGSFFLGSGNLNNEYVYRYVYSLPDGGHREGNVKIEKATIYEDETESPYIECVGKDNCCFGWGDSGISAFSYCNVAFHIPPNTINRNFTLDITK